MSINYFLMLKILGGLYIQSQLHTKNINSVQAQQEEMFMFSKSNEIKIKFSFFIFNI
jgi:hypothetical protein